MLIIMDEIRDHESSHKMENGKVNKGIGCDVQNCYYHDPSNYCTADQINVGPVSAVTSADTICVTFRPKDIE